MSKPKIIAVVGPTASGKTALGVMLAKHYNGEVISADSMQIYKGMDIASAKPAVEEMEGIPHHLINFLERDTVFSVADYVQLAKEKIEDVLSRGKLPIIVGGTGLYVSSLLDNTSFTESENDEEYRKSLYEFAEKFGNEALHKRLEEIDPQTAKAVHMNDLVRVTRALEAFHVTGKTMTQLKAESHLTESPYDSLILCLDYADRQQLYDRINLRVDKMVEAGLVDEARSLWEQFGSMKTSANAIGFKELIPFFENKASIDECLDKIKQETRRYAKRQMTWFRKNERIYRINIGEFDKMSEIYEKSKKCIANRFDL